MKKQITIAILFLLSMLLFNACSSDDDTQTTGPVDPPVSGNEAPVFNAQTFTASEDIKDNVIIGKISATDAENDTLTFTLTQNSDDLFELTNTGELSLANGKALDYEKVTSYEITVEVSDGTNKTTAIITVNVENIIDTPFVTIWKTTTANETITIPISSLVSTDYDYTIDWGDGTVENAKTESGNHEYATPGTYTVSILGAFPAIRMEETGDGSNIPNKLQSIEQWGEIQWESLNLAFVGCENMIYNAKDAPNLSNVTDISAIFARCRKFNPPSLNSWDVSNVENMSGAFAGTAFNGDISQWDVSNVINMISMFKDTSVFNRDLSQWNVGKVRDMSGMFQSAIAFNQDLNTWNVSAVTRMRDMFNGASAFNGNVSTWNVSKLGDMVRMFTGARSFNGDLSQWDISDVGNMINMLDETNMSTENYDKLLTSWSKLDLKPSVIFGVQGLTYCDSETDRAKIIRDHAWIFRGDTERCLGL